MATTDDPLEQRTPPRSSNDNFNPNSDLITIEDGLKSAAQKSRSGEIKARKQQTEIRTNYYYDKEIEKFEREIGKKGEYKKKVK